MQISLVSLFFGLALFFTDYSAHAQSVTRDPAAELSVDAPASPGLAVTYFLDTTGQISAEQAEQLLGSAFLKFSPQKPLAIGQDSLWLRFEADGSRLHGSRLTLPMATVDDVTLFYRDVKGQWIQQLGGDILPMSQWAQRGRYPSFVLSGEARAVPYLMRVRHQRGLFSTEPLVLSESSFISVRQNEHMFLGMYFGLALLVVVLAFSRAAVYRDAGFASYAIYVGLLALALASGNGVAALYLWPEWPISNWVLPVLSALTVSAMLFFLRVIIQPERFSRWLDRVVLVMIGLMPLAGIINVWQPSGWGFAVYSSMVLISGLALLLTIAGALRRGDYDSRWIAWGFFPIFVVFVVSLFRNFGVIRDSAFTELMVPMASAVEVVILFFGLHQRVSQRQSVATRITRLWKIDPLTGLDTKELLLTRLAQTMEASVHQHQPYALLVIDLANVQALENQWGREATDRALVVAASCIRVAAQANDALARIGHAQFGLLMQNPVSLHAAQQAAEKIIQSSRKEARGLLDAQTLTFHIAIGHSSTEQVSQARNAESILAHLLDAAISMKHGWKQTTRLVVI